MSAPIRCGLGLRLRLGLAFALSTLAACASLVKTSGSALSTSIGAPSATDASGAAASIGGDYAVVPDLIGRTRDEAAALVRAAGFTQALESTRPVECQDAPALDGRVNCQDPAAGSTVKRYTMVQINVHQSQRLSNLVVRAQLAALVGMSPDQARAALASYGHDGGVTFKPDDRFHAGCGDGRVCDTGAPSSSGIGIHDPIVLYVNPSLTISAPPP